MLCNVFLRTNRRRIPRCWIWRHTSEKTRVKKNFKNLRNSLMFFALLHLLGVRYIWLFTRNPNLMSKTFKSFTQTLNSRKTTQKNSNFPVLSQQTLEKPWTTLGKLDKHLRTSQKTRRKLEKAFGKLQKKLRRPQKARENLREYLENNKKHLSAMFFYALFCFCNAFCTMFCYVLLCFCNIFRMSCYVLLCFATLSQKTC